MAKDGFGNPFRPGAGHMPPYLAGRQKETDEFLRLLDQELILENLVLTGLRGVGKTVLLDTLKPLALQRRWLWVGADLSETTSISEDRVATRLMTDLAPLTSSIVLNQSAPVFGFGRQRKQSSWQLNFDAMNEIYQETPGMPADKLRARCSNLYGLV